MSHNLFQLFSMNTLYPLVSFISTALLLFVQSDVRFAEAKLLLTPCTQESSSQMDIDTTIYCGIQKVYPAYTLSRAELETAKTLRDLNDRYEEEWVAEYFTVSVATSHDGTIQETHGSNDTLTQEQRSHLLTADSGVPIRVTVSYLPKNTLKVNEKKSIDFNCFVEPETTAVFDSDQSLESYLDGYFVDLPLETLLQGYDLGAYTFTIDTSGHVINPQVRWSSGNSDIDSMGIAALCAMPMWIPAQYNAGNRVAEDNVLLIGNLDNCMLYTLNLAQTWLTKE